MADTKFMVQVIAGIVLVGLVSGIIGAWMFNNTVGKDDSMPSKEELIAEFYATENAVHVSPHSIRKSMDKGDASFILVDLRSQQEYEREHIIGAVNIPAYKDPDTSAYGDKERIVNSFKQLPKDKDVIVYCYSIPCMTGRKIGAMLAEEGIYVKHLGIGWNEWRYHWTLWNHEHEWNLTKVEEYIASGAEPGTPKSKKTSGACPIEGEFGC
jgi:rhodanese-related sulfurtransferase